MHTFKKLGVAFGSSIVTLGLVASSAMASTSIVNTGNGFTFTNTHTTTKTATVSNSNSNTSSQTANTTANTGGNTSNSNIGGGGIMTGMAAVANYFSVLANSNWTGIQF